MFWLMLSIGHDGEKPQTWSLFAKLLLAPEAKRNAFYFNHWHFSAFFEPLIDTFRKFHLVKGKAKSAL